MEGKIAAREAEQYRIDKEATKPSLKSPTLQKMRELQPPGGMSCCHWGRSSYWDRQCAWCSSHIADGSLARCLL